MKWTKELSDNVINFIKSGYTYKEVSNIFNVTSDSIRGRCFKLNIKSSDYSKDYNKKFICLECGCEFINNKNGRKFCSHSCSAKFNNKPRNKNENKKCLNCDCDIKNVNTYCSNKCQQDFQYNKKLERWKNNEFDGNKRRHKYALSNIVRKYIFNKYNHKCSKCGWNEINQYTGNVPLEIDHIDGNYLNSVEENLRLLCPSCHSLTEFYGSRNKGRGREFRRKK